MKTCKKGLHQYEPIKKKAIEYNRVNRDRAKGNRLRRNYWPHLTWQQALIEYERLLKSQNHCCAICRVHKTEFKKALAVDHDHETTAVRGLLCKVCNHLVCGGIDKRASANKVQMTKLGIAESAYAYYRKNYREDQDAHVIVWAVNRK